MLIGGVEMILYITGNGVLSFALLAAFVAAVPCGCCWSDRVASFSWDQRGAAARPAARCSLLLDAFFSPDLVLLLAGYPHPDNAVQAWVHGSMDPLVLVHGTPSTLNDLNVSYRRSGVHLVHSVAFLLPFAFSWRCTCGWCFS